ncbi:MAG: hypothetical protein QOD57_5786 [Actinomycetota bacterium]|nr:hypothetical protein [Actinomycetota bacterium]
MDLEALALAVDDRIRVPAAERSSGRLSAVRSESDAEGDGVALDLLAEGEARTLPQRVRVPAGVQAIALASGVWVAPMEDDGPNRPPSQHPERRRAHLTVLISSEDDRDAVDVAVLRYGDGAPTVLRGGVGLIHQRMLRCWSRRPEAPWATTRSDPAARR